MIHLILALFTFTAYAQLKDVDVQPIAFKNILKNGGFENGKALFSVTGSASLTTSTSNPAFGKVKGVVDFSASGEFMRTATTTLPEGLYGKNCYARFKYSGGGTADIYYRVTDGTNTLAGYTSTSTQFKITTAASTWTDSLDLTFPCPSSGGLRLELESAGNAAALSIDDIYIGENFKVGSVSQAEIYGTLKYSGTTNCAWSTTSASVANFAADTDCPTATVSGSVAAAGTKIPGIVLNNAKPGLYKVTASFRTQTSAAGTDCHLNLSDGTITTGKNAVYSSGGGTSGGTTLVGYFPYTEGQSSKTIQIQARTSAPTCFIYNGETSDLMEFVVERFPLSSEVAVSANVPYQGGKLDYTGAANCNWDTTSSSFADFSADSDCSTPSTTGIVTSSGKTPSFNVASLEAGTYLLVASGTQEQVSGGYTCTLRMTDGTNYSPPSALYTNSGVNGLAGFTMTQVFTYTSKQSNLTFKVQGRVSTGSTCRLQGNWTSQSTFAMHLIPLSPSVAMPNLVGSVTSNTTGSERTERVTFGGATEGTNVCSSSPCTIYRGSGGVSSVTRTGTGAYEINFVAGTFSAIPTCNGNGSNLSTGFTTLEPVFSGSSATVFKFNARIFGTSNSADSYMNIQCQGPR